MAEKVYVDAKLELHKRQELKERLTEHLMNIINKRMRLPIILGLTGSQHIPELEFHRSPAIHEPSMDLQS